MREQLRALAVPYKVIEPHYSKADNGRTHGQGRSKLAAASKIFGIADQTLHNWVKADREGRLQGPGSKPASTEQMEMVRLHAENARLKMERDILEKTTATAKKRIKTREQARKGTAKTQTSQ